jgi:predicted Zn-dependent protease
VAREVLAESHMRRSGTPERFRDTEFTFRVLDSPVINAFALPGGYVYVTRGLLAHLNNEAQLAVVLGHEIGHVAARHASQQAGRQQLTKGLLLGGAVAGAVAFGRDVANQVVGLGGQAAQLLSLSYSRGNERESDRLGVEYATMAGYDAAEGAAFFTTLKRMQEQSDQSIPTWQSTHPDPGAREETIGELAQTWRQKVERPATTRDQETYYGALEQTVLGENPRQGFVEEDVFYHPELAFQFPTPPGWTVRNQPRQVAVVQPSQEAYMLFGFAEAETPEAAAQSLMEQEGLTVVESGAMQVHGLPAHRVRASGQTQKDESVRLLAYFIEYEGQVYQFRGLTPAAQYDAYRPAFVETMNGFRQLRDQEILGVQPTRLAIRPASRTAAFRTFVEEGARPESMNGTDLAILNQLGLGTTVESGRPLKLPSY